MVKLCNLQQRVTDLLQVTKLLTVFDVYETEEEAVKSFTRSAVA
jgi:anti-sigma B factor antagonist